MSQNVNNRFEQIVPFLSPNEIQTLPSQSEKTTYSRLTSPKVILILLISLTLIAFVSYLPVLNNHFVNWDDPEAIQGNAHLHHIDFKWMFTTFILGNWIPLNWFSLTLDYQLGGLNPKIYHIHNLILHTLNSIWVFLIALKIFNINYSQHGNKSSSMTTPLTSFLAALLFAIHPLHVESVAWATERKDVLCGFFFLACLWTYLIYGSGTYYSTRKWLTTLVLFILALLSKPMAITLPFILLLLDFWPLDRINREGFRPLLKEKSPFFVISCLSVIITIVAQSHAKALWAGDKLPLDFRLTNACHSLILYISKIFSPIHLSTFYPLPSPPRAFTFSNLTSCVLVVLLTALAFGCRKSRPYITAGWIYYVVTLLPVLGIIQVGGQAAADRYAYLPSLGPLLLLAIGMTALLDYKTKGLIAMCVFLAVGLGQSTYRQASLWKDSVTLWENVVQQQGGDSCIAHSNLANAYQNVGRPEDALREYDEAIFIEPSSATPHNGKGVVLAARNLNEAAEAEFKTAVSLEPSNDLAHFNLWLLYDRLGRRDDAVHEMQEATRLNPANPAYDNFIGISYGYQNRHDLAVPSFQKALAADPNNADYLANLATAYQHLGRYDRAIHLYLLAIHINPTDPVYRLNLGNTYLLNGMNPKAIETLHQAENLMHNDKSIFKKLGEAYQKIGDLKNSSKYFNLAKTSVARQYEKIDQK